MNALWYGISVQDLTILWFLFCFNVVVWAPIITFAAEALVERYNRNRQPPRKSGGLLI